MYRCKIESVASKIAIEKNQPYGMSVLDGAWYVGNRDELIKVGINEILYPDGNKECVTSIKSV